MKKYYLLDFDGLSDKKELHCYIQNKLKLPEYYGKNLDALNDCLWEVNACVILRHIGALDRFGDYGRTLMEVFRGVAQRSERFEIIELDDDQ